ncbi:MAG: radical SAM protein [Phycisphaerales bacterium]
MDTPFVAFVPLSEWTRGFDRYAMRYSKELLPASRHPDCFFMMKVGENLAPALEKVRSRIARTAVHGDRVVALRADLPERPGAMVRNTHTGTGVGWRWPKPWIPLASFGLAAEDGSFAPQRHETLTALAYQLETNTLVAWADCRPRTLSVLPIARACNAKCAFCFSKASLSEMSKQPPADESLWSAWAKAASLRGAERAVITGGGEPGLLEPRSLERLTAALAGALGKVLMITNGSRLADLDDGELSRRLASLVENGLTKLAISRHGIDEREDERIMGIRVCAARVARVSRESAPRLGLRSICVLQRGAVDSPERVKSYLRRMASEGFDEVCFKELYVSAISENSWAPSPVNLYCEQQQVPLAMVVNTLADLGFEVQERLPWGSPVFTGTVDGVLMKVAAYTEPSVGWERSRGTVRSWNLLADGGCFASLEDPSSKLELAAQPG